MNNVSEPDKAKSNFSRVLEELRQKKDIKKQDLAARAGLTPSYVSHLTLGSRENPSEETVIKLANALKLDKEERMRLFEAAELSFPTESIPALGGTARQEDEIPTEDWDGIPNVQAFFGREDELKELKHWVLDKRCQLVVVAGTGGVGKTILATRLARDIAGEFAYVFWRSLKDAPPVERLIEQALLLLSSQKPLNPHLNIDERIGLLIEYMKNNRCLLVLDNLESILQAKEQAGEYRQGYEDYGKLINTIGETLHESCLLLTTRELPKGKVLLAGRVGPVRVFGLSGLKAEDGLKVLEDKGLVLSKQAAAAEQLVDLYTGNPLALIVAAQFIQDAFAGDIGAFLESNNSVFQDIQSVLEQQFERLPLFEQQIMYWLAIEREPITTRDIQHEFAELPEIKKLAEALQSLRRRSLIEVREFTYTLQPVILEFVTNKLMKRVGEEIGSESIALLDSHVLLKAQSKDYIREAQRRLILEPVAQHLTATYGKQGCEAKLKALLHKLHETFHDQPGYAAGNLLNLLVYLGYNLNGYNFSHLFVWQAYLRGISLNHVNFAGANLEHSVFTEDFTSILSVALSSDNRWLAAGTENGEVRMWDVGTGTPFRSYQGHGGRVRSVAFSPDGKMIASGSEDYTIRLWSSETGQNLHILLGHTDRVRAVDISPDGKLLVSGSDDGTVRVWDLRKGSALHVLKGHTDRVRAASFSPDGTTIASGGEDTTIHLWDVESGHCLKTFEGHEKQVHAVSFSPDSKLLVSGSEDRTIRIWNIESGQCIQQLEGHTNQVRSVTFHPAGDRIASGSDDTSIRLWDIQSGQCLKTFEGHLHRVYSVIFSYDGTTITSGSEDQTIRVWDVQSAQCLKTLQGYVNQIRSIAFDPSGNMLVSGGDDHRLRLWDVQTGQQLKVLVGHTNGIRAVSFSPDGTKIGSGSDDRTVRLWESTSGKNIRVLREHSDRVRTIAFSHDGRHLASGGEDQVVRIWDTTSGQRLKVLQGHSDWVRSVAFSPDDTLLVSSGEDYTMRVWNSKTGTCLAILKQHKNGVRCVAFSPDGRLLASSSDDETICLWDTTTWEHRKTLQAEQAGERISWILSITFSPDGSLLASGGEDKKVRIWDVESGKCLKTLAGHEHRIYSVTFHPDGQLLASGSLDGTIRLWNVETGVCLRVLRNNKPYEGVNITDIQGVTETQKSIFKDLGAIEE